MDDLEYKYFKKWYKSQERRFHCGHFSPEDEACAGFYKGIEFERERHLTPAAPDAEGQCENCNWWNTNREFKFCPDCGRKFPHQ